MGWVSWHRKRAAPFLVAYHISAMIKRPHLHHESLFFIEGGIASLIDSPPTTGRQMDIQPPRPQSLDRFRSQVPRWTRPPRSRFPILVHVLTRMMQPSGPTDPDIPTAGSSMSPDASSDDSFGDSIQGSSSARHWRGPRGLAYHICQGNLDRKFGHRRPPANVGCQNVELSPDLCRITKEPIRSYSIYWEGQ